MLRGQAIVATGLFALLLSLAPLASAQTLVTTVSTGNGGAEGPPVFDAANGNIYVSATGSLNDGSVTIVSGSTNAVVATLYLGGHDEAQKGVLDTINGDVYVPGSGSDIHVLSGTTNKFIQNLTAGSCCTSLGLAFDKSNAMMYVSNLLDSTISVLNTSNNSIIATIHISSGSSTPLVDPVNGEVYVPGFNGTTMVSASTDKVLGTVKASGSLGLDISTGSVLISGNGRLVMLSSTDKVVANVSASGASPIFDAVNSDFYLTTLNSALLVFSATSGTVVGNVNLSSNPSGAAVDSSNGDVLVTYTGGSPASSYADVISGMTDLGSVLIAQGTSFGPGAPVFDSSNGYFYVPGVSGDIAVVDPTVTAAATTTTPTTTQSSSSSLTPGYALLIAVDFGVMAAGAVLVRARRARLARED